MAGNIKDASSNERRDRFSSEEKVCMGTGVVICSIVGERTDSRKDSSGFREFGHVAKWTRIRMKWSGRCKIVF